MSIQIEEPTNEQDIAEDFVSTFYQDQASTGETEAGDLRDLLDLLDMYDYSRSLTPSSIKGEEGSDEVVSELEENNETNNVMSAEKQARLRSSTIKDSRASEDKGVSTEQDYSSKTAQEFF